MVLLRARFLLPLLVLTHCAGSSGSCTSCDDCQLSFCQGVICYMELGAGQCVDTDGNITHYHDVLSKVDEESCALHCTGDPDCGGYTYIPAGRCCVDPVCGGRNCQILSNSGPRAFNDATWLNSLKTYKCVRKIAVNCPSIDHSMFDQMQTLTTSTKVHGQSQLLTTAMHDPASNPYFLTTASKAVRQQPWHVLVWQGPSMAIALAIGILAALLPSTV